MKIFALLALLITTPAFAGDFNLNLEGKTFTCTESGSAGGGCQCREFQDPNYPSYVNIGLFMAGETNNDRYIWKQVTYGGRQDVINSLRACVEQKKSESLCQ